nr:MAG TPA: hypothetical protein [Caudoviricetes sp.]
MELQLCRQRSADREVCRVRADKEIKLRAVYRRYKGLHIKHGGYRFRHTLRQSDVVNPSPCRAKRVLQLPRGVRKTPGRA